MVDSVLDHFVGRVGGCLVGLLFGLIDWLVVKIHGWMDGY